MRSPVENGAKGDSEASPSVGLFLVTAMAILMGVNFPFMKIALADIPVLTYRVFNLVVAGLGLFAIAKASGHRISVPRPEVRPLIVCALFNMTFWHILSAYGLALIEASRMTIIAHTMPIWVAPLSVLILGERLSARRLVSLALGTLGLAVLIGPDIARVGSAPLGALLTLAAAISWALGAVLTKHYRFSAVTPVLVGWQLLIGVVPIVAAAAIVDPLPDPRNWSLTSTLVLTYTATVPSMFGIWAFFRLLHMFPATVTAIGTLSIPTVGVLTSALVLGESIGLGELAALALVSAAVALSMARSKPVAASPKSD